MDNVDHFLLYLETCAWRCLLNEALLDAEREGDGWALMSHWQVLFVELFQKQHTDCFWAAHRMLAGNLLYGCESSDFNLISDFFALHKTPFSDFYCIEAHLFRHFRLFQTFPHRCSNTPVTCSYDHCTRGGGGGGLALELGRGLTYTVNGPYGPHTPISVYLRVIFLAPHTRTHVLCMGSGSATGFFSCGEISAF